MIVLRWKLNPAYSNPVNRLDLSVTGRNPQRGGKLAGNPPNCPFQHCWDRLLNSTLFYLASLWFSDNPKSVSNILCLVTGPVIKVALS